VISGHPTPHAKRSPAEVAFLVYSAAITGISCPTRPSESYDGVNPKTETLVKAHLAEMNRSHSLSQTKLEILGS
jgi:hypothetical protein